MFFFPSVRRQVEFRSGALAMRSIAPGTGAWALMTGVAMVKSGLTPVEALAMTFLVYAGSAQLAALPLIAAGAPAWVIMATAFCVNLRFVVFSLHLRDYLMYMPRWRRLVNGYFTADMGYVLLIQRFPTPATDDAGRKAQEAYVAGTYAVSWLTWTGMSVLGIALGDLIPTSWGLAFAGVLSLIGILCSLANTPLRVLSVAVAGAVAVLAYAMPYRLNVVTAILAAVVIAYTLEQRLPTRARPA